MANKGGQKEIGAGQRHRSIEIDEGSSSSDLEEDSWHSTCGSKRSGSCDECKFSAGPSSVSGSDCCSDVDLESGALELKVHRAKVEKDCRICHLSLEGANQESGIPIELGCSCKDDLAAAHKNCAEAWFKIKGNRICEICGATACNVVIVTVPEIFEQPIETSNAISSPLAERRGFWHGHRFLNSLLACMVFAFAVSWLFHFNF